MSWEYTKGIAIVKSGGNTFHPIQGEVSSRLSEGWSSGNFSFEEEQLGFAKGDYATIEFIRGSDSFPLFSGEVTEINNINKNKDHPSYEVLFDGEGRKLDWRIAQLPSGTITEEDYLGTLMSYMGTLMASSINPSLTNTVSLTRGTSGRRMVWESITQFCSDKTIDFAIHDETNKIFFFHSPLGTIDGTFNPIILRNKTDSIKKLKTRITLYNHNHLIHENKDWWSESTLYTVCKTADGVITDPTVDGTVMLLTGLGGRPDYTRDYSVVARGTTETNFQVWIGITPDSILPAVKSFNFSYIPIMSKHYQIGRGDQDKLYMKIYLSETVCPYGSMPTTNYIMANKGLVNCLSAGPHDKLATLTTDGFKDLKLDVYEGDFSETVGTWSGSVGQAIIHLSSTVVTFMGGEQEFRAQPVKQAGLIMDGIFFENIISYTHSHAGSESSFGVREYLPDDEYWMGDVELGSITAKARLGGLWKPELSLREVVIEGTESPFVGYNATFNFDSTLETYMITEVNHIFDGDDWRTKMVCSSSKAHPETKDRALKIRDLSYSVRQLKHFANEIAQDTDVIIRKLPGLAFGDNFPSGSDELGGTIYADDLVFNGTITSIGTIGNIGLIENMSVGSITSIGTIGIIESIEQLNVGSLGVLGTADITFADIDNINVAGAVTIGIGNVDNIGTISTLSAGIILGANLQVAEIASVGVMNITNATIETIYGVNDLFAANMSVSNVGTIDTFYCLTEATFNAITQIDNFYALSGTINQGTFSTVNIASATLAFAYFQYATIDSLHIEAGTIENVIFNNSTVNWASMTNVGELNISSSTIGTIFIGSIASENIVLSSNIGVGAVETGNLAANAVTASKLYIGDDAGNKAHNPSFEVDSDGNNQPDQWTLYVEIGAGATVGLSNMQFHSGTMSIEMYADSADDVVLGMGDFIPVSAGQVYVISAYARGASAMNNVASSWMYYYDEDQVYDSAKPGNSLNVTTSWQQTTENKGTVPANVYYMRPAIRLEGVTGANTIFFDEVVLEREVSSVMIADGAITADKIYANAVTSAKIEAGAITSDEITTDWITARKFRTSASGARIEFDSSQIVGYDSGSNAQFVAQSTTGKFLAGAGSVILDRNGITTKGQCIYLKNASDVLCGYLFGGDGGQLVINSVAGEEIVLSPGGGVGTVNVPHIRPASGGGYDCGTETYYWEDIWCNTLHYMAQDASPWDEYNDLELVKYKTKLDNQGKIVYDGDPLSFLKEGKFYSVGKSNAFIFGCLKQTSYKFDTYNSIITTLYDTNQKLEERIKKLEDDR